MEETVSDRSEGETIPHSVLTCIPFLQALTMATTTPPSKTVLLVTGAWHVPAHYTKVTSALTAADIRVLAPLLPTNNNAQPPTATLADDVALIRGIVTQELATSPPTQKLTVLAHSYGGIVTTAALADLPTELAAAERLHIVYMAAFMPLEGESLMGILGGGVPPWIVLQADGSLALDGAGEVFYQDVGAEDARKEAERLLVVHVGAAQAAGIECGRAAWRVVPVSYILCEEDGALMPAVQERMVEKVRGEGVEFVEVLRLRAGHSPFLRVPEKVVEFVVKRL